MDGILRLMNKSDDEWKEIFEQYFNFEKLDYYHWDGEPETVKRRIFYLRNKQ